MPLLKTVETFPIDSVKAERLPNEIFGFHELPGIVQDILKDCPVVVSLCDDDQLELPFDGAFESNDGTIGKYTLSQATPEHQRSFIVEGDQLDQVWHDEFGNTYGVFTLKGNNFSHSQLIETATAHDRFIGYGLQESAVIERVLRASDMLRRAGIGTEYIVGLAEPKSYQLRDNDVTVRHEELDVIEYKKILAEKYWRSLPEDKQDLEQFTEIFTKLQRSTFYISMRATDTAYRFFDALKYPDARRKVLEECNQRHGTSYDINNREDWEAFVESQFTPALAKNIARLHALGLAHRFPNQLNVTAFGSIVDVDSVHGEPLGFGDDPIDMEDIARDIFTATIDLDYAGFDYNFKPKPDILNQFLDIYFSEYELASQGQSTLHFQTAVLSALAKYASTRKESSSIFSNNNARDVALEKLSGYMLGLDKINITEKWLEASEEQLKDSMVQCMTDHAHTYGTYLVMTMFHAFGDEFTNYGTDFYDYCLGEKSKTLRSDNIVYEVLFRDMVVHVLASSYEQYVKANFLDLLIPKDGVDVPPEMAEIAAAQFSEVFDDGILVDAWIGDTLEELLPQFKDLFNSFCTIKAVDYVQIPGNQKNSPINVTCDNVMIMESHGLTLQSVLDYAREHSVDITLNQPVYRPDAYTYFKGASFIVPEGHHLIQVISDVQPDGHSVDYANENELRASSIDVDSDHQTFIVYVTVDADRKKHFALDINDAKLLSMLKDASQETIAAALATDSVGMAQLFDATQYIEKPFTDFQPQVIRSSDL